MKLDRKRERERGGGEGEGEKGKAMKNKKREMSDGKLDTCICLARCSKQHDLVVSL